MKAARPETPRAVLLIDVVGHSAPEAARGVEKIRAILEEHPNTLLFEARDAAEAEALLGRPQEARRHRAAHQRLQAERGHRPPARGAGGVRPLPRRPERRGGALRAGPAAWTGWRRSSAAPCRPRTIRSGWPPRSRPRSSAARGAATPSPGPAAKDLRSLALLEDFRRDAARAGPRLPGAHPRHGPGAPGGARPAGGPRHAHARGRRQRARERAGAVQRPGHAGAGRAGHRPGHGQGGRARRRGLRRARHRRHQAQVPRARADRRSSRPTGARWTPARS